MLLKEVVTDSPNVKKISLGLVALACALLATQSFGEARKGGYVRGYTRKDGTYVSGYYRGGSSGGYSSSSSSGYSGSSSSYSYSSTTFANCTAAKAAGYSNMTVGSAGYSSKLDRDGDGVACESGSGSSGSSGSAGLGLMSGSATTTAPKRPAAALPGTAYFKAKDLEGIGGSISKLPADTYQLAAFKHTVSLVPNSIIILNDGKEVRVAAAPVIYQNSLYVPAQYLYKLGCNVDMADSYMVMATCPNYTIFSSTNVAVW